MSPSPGGAQVSPVLDFMALYWRMQLYDNSEFDVEAGLQEFYREFLGPGVEGMSRFYTAVEKRWVESGGGAESRSWGGKMGTPELLAEVRGHAQQAREATAEDSLYRKRVELIEPGILEHMRQGRTRYGGSAMAEETPIGTAGVAQVETTAGPACRANPRSS